jgi:DNA-nicking Smr family endonuclease
MNDDENDLFQQEMAGVKPLKRESRVALVRETVSSDTLSARREAATEDNRDPNFLVSDGIAPLDPWYVLDFKRPGVQNGVYRKLKQGRYEAEARLNLHRMGVERARREVFEFIMQAERYGLRSVLIIHGKGENSGDREQASLLKGCVDHWLRQIDQVQAYHSARPQHGGTGAAYVLLRKSEEQKQKNRELYRG